MNVLGAADDVSTDSCDSTNSSENPHALVEACVRGETREVRELLQLKETAAMLNSMANKHGSTALHVACREVHLPIARLLLDAGADKWIRNATGADALQIAIYGNSLPLVQLLLEGEDDINRVSRQTRRAPLHCAALFAKPLIMEWLLQQGADPNVLLPKNSKTACHLLCDGPLGGGPPPVVECLKLLHRHKVDPLRHDQEGKLPIHYAQSLPVVQALVTDLQVPVDATDLHGWTAMHHAADALWGRTEILRWLVSKDGGADVNARTHAGETPLLLAMRRTCKVKPGILVDAGADVTAEDSLGRNPLLVALAYRLPQQSLDFLHAHFLLDGGNVRDTTTAGWMALHYAIYYNWHTLAKTLLEAGARIGDTTENGQSPLHFIGTKNYRIEVGAEEEMYHAALAGRIDTAKFPVFRTSGRKRTAEGNDVEPTAIHVGLAWPVEDAAVYQLCLASGGDCTIQDSSGNLPFFLAAATGWMDATFDMLRISATQGLFEGLSTRQKGEASVPMDEAAELQQPASADVGAQGEEEGDEADV
jgi:ankyrin repeat protein